MDVVEIGEGQRPREKPGEANQRHPAGASSGKSGGKQREGETDLGQEVLLDAGGEVSPEIGMQPQRQRAVVPRPHLG